MNSIEEPENTHGSAFDCYAILELMGHRRLAGRVTDATIGGGSFLRIDIPTKDGKNITQFYSPASVYCISPTTEDIARKEVEKKEGDEEKGEEMAPAPVYFKVVYVFDVSQTEGKPLPEFHVPVLTGEANEELFQKALELAKLQGLTVSFEPRPGQDPAIKGIFYGNQIWIKGDESRAQQLKSLLHELAHYYNETAQGRCRSHP